MKVADVVPSSRVRHSLGFDDVAIVPASMTIDPEDVDTSWRVGQSTFAIPFIAAAMDGAVDPAFAIALGKAGGLAVLNLEGLQTRYDHPEEALQAITKASSAEATAVLQQVYRQPVQERLIGERISEIKRSGVTVAASATPAMADVHGPIAVEAGLDIFVVQSTVTTARHRSSSRPQLSLERLRRELEIPIVVGNCVSYQAAHELMETGIDGVLVGVGPGAACTSREVLGIGVPQVTATMETAAARDAYFQATGRYVPIITDGGMRTGGDICKAFASGADAVMLGSVFAQALEAPGAKASPEPGYGYHWGMASPHEALPRGTRIKVAATGSLQQILFGPTSRSDGTQNLVGALRTCMGLCGAATIGEMHNAEIVIAPAIKTEGKIWQLAGSL